MKWQSPHFLEKVLTQWCKPQFSLEAVCQKLQDTNRELWVCDWRTAMQFVATFQGSYTCKQVADEVVEYKKAK